MKGDLSFDEGINAYFSSYIQSRRGNIIFAKLEIRT